MQQGSTKSLDAVVDEQAKPRSPVRTGLGHVSPTLAYVASSNPRSPFPCREQREARLGPCGRSAEATGGASRAPGVMRQRRGCAVAARGGWTLPRLTRQGVASSSPGSTAFSGGWKKRPRQAAESGDSSTKNGEEQKHENGVEKPRCKRQRGAQQARANP
jgi:hypothetical protein